METYSDAKQRQQLIDRQRKLREWQSAGDTGGEIQMLLEAIDDALGRMDAGRYGYCKTCGGHIEQELLQMDPVIEVCLPHLTPRQVRLLEHDLELAARIQREMLPPRSLAIPGWDTAYHYAGAGLVSGDYCDLLSPDGETLFFLIGDVTGKGHAASMLMSHLHAAFLALLNPGADLEEVFTRASRIFCDSSLSNQFATLFCGKANPRGDVEFCLAGHPPPMMLNRGELTRLNAQGLPLGMFCQQGYTLGRREASPGDLILLFSDGVTESTDPGGGFYGEDRLAAVLQRHADAGPDDVVQAVVNDLAAFSAGSEASDDVTVMAIRHTLT